MYRLTSLKPIVATIALYASQAQAVTSGDVVSFAFPNDFGPDIVGVLTYIGFTGTGQVSFEGQGANALDSGFLGWEANAHGQLDLGDGATVNLSSFTLDAFGEPVQDALLFAGIAGRGDIAITGGAVLNGARYVGVGMRGVGTLAVDGENSALNLQGWIAHDVVSVFGSTVPGNTQAALSIGGGGEGAVTVRNGGRINLTQSPGRPVNDLFGLAVSVGDTDPVGGQGGKASLAIDGPGSRISVTGNSARLWVGAVDSELNGGAPSAVAITNGGEMVLSGSPIGFDFAAVGALTGQRGEMLIEGADSRLDAGDVLAIATNATLTDFDPNNDIAAGTGTVTVRDGGVIETDFGVYIGAGGTLSGDGKVIADVLNLGGTISPGNSPGRLLVDGDVSLSGGGKLVLEIASATVFDQLAASGTMQLGGGVIEFVFADGVAPDILELLDIGDFLQQYVPNESGDTFITGVPGDNLLGVQSLTWLSATPGVTIDFVLGQGFAVSTAPIPLPGGAALFPPALLVLAALRRRCQNGTLSRRSAFSPASSSRSRNQAVGAMSD